MVEEMDLDAVLARHPQVAVVDEIAHQRSRVAQQEALPGRLRAARRGINVICAFQFQHLESLKDVVERVTGVVIRETVPDGFLKQADQVVNLDLDAEDLLERLRAGKIYDPAKVSGRSPISSSRTNCRVCASWRCVKSRSGSTCRRRPSAAMAAAPAPRRTRDG
jgi:K+-sensing histidine kinase KdpD